MIGEFLVILPIWWLEVSGLRQDLEENNYRFCVGDYSGLHPGFIRIIILCFLLTPVSIVMLLKNNDTKRVEEEVWVK